MDWLYTISTIYFVLVSGYFKIKSDNQSAIYNLLMAIIIAILWK